MYATVPHLETAIRQSLQKGLLCRIYKESIDACWPRLSSEEQTQRVAHFAALHHWDVEFRLLGSLGTVAEFRKQEDCVHAGE